MNTLEPLTMPKLSAEQWAERERSIKAAEKAEQRRKVLERLDHSGIPRIYRSYDLSQCDEAVQDAYKAIRSGLSVGYVFQGKVGRGKTVSACCCLLEHLKTALGRFATMQRILEDIRGTYSGQGNEGETLSRYRNTKLLVIDDLGKEKPSEFALSKLFEIIDYRISNGLPTIITTQYRGAELIERLGACGEAATAEAIVSRLATFNRLTFAGEDRRLS